MPLISVLTSIYNEPVEEIEQAIDSVVAQTFTDFELIIVNDNPRRSDSRNLLQQYARADNRIRIIENDKNIGLALSMNKAAQKALGSVFVRMDADDISEITRFQKQIEVLKEGGFDLVCSEYVCIDAESNILRDELQKSRYYEPLMIRKQLPYNNSIIHHPTVIFTREIFERVGGYRNFPCAQDYDLWLRMLYVGADFFMIKEPLLKYRIHNNSISFKKNVMQNVTVEYIRRLYIERIKKGTDSFSENAYKKYIGKYEKREPYYKGQIDKGKAELLYANYLSINKKKFSGFIKKIKVGMFNGFYRKHFMNLIHDKLELKLLEKMHIFDPCSRKREKCLKR